MTKSASNAHSTNAVPATAGSACARVANAAGGRPVMAAIAASALGVQDLRDPAVDDAFAVRARVVGVDREQLRVLEHGGERGLECDVGVRGNEVDLVLGEQALHRGRAGPVDQLLRGLRILRAFDE